MNLLDVAVVAIAVATASVTIGKSRFFSALRVFILEISPFLGDLFRCPYCLSHWIALAAVYVTGIRVTALGAPWLAFTLTWLLVVGISSAATKVIAP